MERLSIQGDFFDCQLYGGRLYLWTFDGSLQVYNYSKIIDEWFNKKEWQDLRGRQCHQYEGEESDIYINSVELQKYLIYERGYLTDEFPTSTEVFSGGLYEANAKGLFTCKLPVFKEMLPVEKIWDSPLVYVGGEKYRGLVCAAGSDGMFWMPSVTENREFVHLSPRQTIKASFCNPGIYAQSSEGGAYLLLKENAYNYGKPFINENDLYPGMARMAYGQRMTWSWNNCFYLAESHSLKVFEYVSSKETMKLKDEIHFFYWKGSFVSAASSRCGTVVELDNAICLFEDWNKEDGHCTIIGPVTRWRMYPRSVSFSTHVHIIFNDRMDIVIMNDSIKNWFGERMARRYRR